MTENDRKTELNDVLKILLKHIYIDKSGYTGQPQVAGFFVAAEKIVEYIRTRKDLE